MKKTLLISLLITILSSCVLKTAEQYQSEAQILFEKKDYKGAINLLNKAIIKDDKYIGAYIDRGANKSALDDDLGAIEDFKKILLIDPDNTLALFNIGKMYCNLKEYKLSIEFYNKAFDTKGKAIDTNGNTIYSDLVDNKFVDLGYKYDVKGGDIFYERGIAYYNFNDLKNSFNDFKSCIQQNYNVKESYYWIGCIYLDVKKNDKACECFYKAKENGDNEVEFNEIQKYCK
jgi:tetratricopeptide (TPR) repeat protein